MYHEEPISVGLFEGLKFPNGGPVISHFLFADNVIIMGNGFARNIWNISRLLRGFFLISDLRVNRFKSSIYGVGIQDRELVVFASIIQHVQSWQDTFLVSWIDCGN